MPRVRKGYQAGDEVDAKCTKCKLVLAHTIVAMVGDRIARVRCNTCNGEHAYRSPPSASEATAKKRRAERKTGPLEKPGSRSSATEFEVLVRGKDLSRANKYSPAMTLKLDDAVDHPSFGIGLVTEIREGHKAHVAFPSGGRVLIFGRSPVAVEAAPPPA